MKRIPDFLRTTIFLLFACTVCMFGRQNNDQLSRPLPIDSNVVIGKLENGMTYYIRENRKPEHRAELRLAVNVGSVLEDDDQQGICQRIKIGGDKRIPQPAHVHRSPAPRRRTSAHRVKAERDQEQAAEQLQAEMVIGEEAGDRCEADCCDRAIRRVGGRRTQSRDESDAAAFRQGTAQTQEIDRADRDCHEKTDGDALQQLLHERRAETGIKRS